MQTPLSNLAREELLKVWDALVPVDEIDSRDAANLELLTRPELGITFSKLGVWNLGPEYSKYGRLRGDGVFS